MPKLKEDGAKCNAKNLTNPVQCYTHIYGPITYTREERMIWEAFMRDRFRAKGQEFKPQDYPTTHMVEK